MIQVMFSDHVDRGDVSSWYSRERCHCKLCRLEAPDQNAVAGPFSLSFTADRHASYEGWNFFRPGHFCEELLVHVSYGFEPEAFYGSSVHCFLDSVGCSGDHSHDSLAVFDIVVECERSRIDAVARIERGCL